MSLLADSLDRLPEEEHLTAGTGGERAADAPPAWTLIKAGGPRKEHANQKVPPDTKIFKWNDKGPLTRQQEASARWGRIRKWLAEVSFPTTARDAREAGLTSDDVLALVREGRLETDLEKIPVKVTGVKRELLPGETLEDLKGRTGSIIKEDIGLQFVVKEATNCSNPSCAVVMQPGHTARRCWSYMFHHSTCLRHYQAPKTKRYRAAKRRRQAEEEAVLTEYDHDCDADVPKEFNTLSRKLVVLVHKFGLHRLTKYFGGFLKVQLRKLGGALSTPAAPATPSTTAPAARCVSPDGTLVGLPTPPTVSAAIEGLYHETCRQWPPTPERERRLVQLEALEDFRVSLKEHQKMDDDAVNQFLLQFSRLPGVAIDGEYFARLGVAVDDEESPVAASPHPEAAA